MRKLNTRELPVDHATLAANAMWFGATRAPHPFSNQIASGQMDRAALPSKN
jgi:hypothetical protein